MRTAIYEIQVDGNDISSTVSPLLISLSIKSDDKANADELTLELDDSGGQIELPRMGASVTASLGWDDTGAVVSFEGTVDTASSNGKGKKHEGGGHGGGGGKEHSAGGRGKGRTMSITAKSADMSGKLKDKVSRHADDMNFGDVATMWGQKAGLTVKVDASLASVHRKYWSMARESFTTWATARAHELGGTFTMHNNIAVFTPRGGGTSASGKALTQIDVSWGSNLMEWSIDPVLSRPDFGTFGTQWYDPQAATHKIETSTGTSKSAATHIHHTKAPTKDQAQKQSDSNKGESAREKGSGSVTIDGNPDAIAGALANVSGIRDGVDGQYLISGVTHSLSRHSGFLTHLDLKQPQAGAGTDARASSTKAG